MQISFRFNYPVYFIRNLVYEYVCATRLQTSREMIRKDVTLLGI